MKICPTCKIEKSYIEFNKRTSTKDGFRSQCRECEKQRSKKYSVKNANKINAYQIQYRIDNKDKDTQYRVDNAQRYKEYGKQYRQTPQGKLVNKVKCNKRRASLISNTPSGKHFTANDIILKLKLQHGKCIYCATDIRECYQIDHFIPLCEGGSNEAWNIQLLCRKCNGTSGKGSKLPHEFAQEHGKLV